jgi:hypothetical protein
LPKIGVPGILTGSAMREHRVEKRAVSDDFWISSEPYEEGVWAKISSEGALLGGALGEAGLDVASASPEHRDGGEHS